MKKYIKKPGEYGLKLYLSDTDLINQISGEFVSLCTKERCFPVHMKQNEQNQDFLFIDFKKDVKKAKIIMKKILFKIYRVPIDTQYYYHFENISLEDVLIKR